LSPFGDATTSRLAGVRLAIGVAEPTAASGTVTFVSGAKATSAVIEGRAPATGCFALRTVTHDIRQGRLSRVVSKRVR
jgi:hypothetical protein